MSGSGLSVRHNYKHCESTTCSEKVIINSAILQKIKLKGTNTNISLYLTVVIYFYSIL